MFKEEMNQYEESAGRPLEVIVGIITFVIALVFLLLLVMLVTEASLGWPLLIGSVLLSLACYWFGLLSVRLILNKRNSQGGLLSVGGIKFWCVVLGCSSFGMLFIGISRNEVGTMLGALGMLIACYYGWGMASKRSSCEKT